MISRFWPKEHYSSVYEIDYGGLWEKGFRGLIFDIDNTLAVFDVPLPPDEVLSLFERLKGLGFKLCLFSNNSEARVKGFNEPLGLPAIHKAGKPKKKGIGKALALLDLPKEQAVIIGDQLFTDIWGGNRSGVYTVLVEPLAKRDEWTVKLKRAPEKFVKRMYLKHKNKTKKVGGKQDGR